MKMHKNLGMFIYKLRSLNEMSQNQFGKVVGLSVQQMSNAERGVSSFPKHARSKLGKIKGFDKNKLQTALIKDETEYVVSKLNG